ncbi:MAG: GAF domain-containing protein [Vicinamibacterales bacterium]
MRLAGVVCGAVDAILWAIDGAELVVRAHHGPLPATIGARQPIHGSVAGYAVREARVVQVEDLTEADDFPVGRDFARRLGHRTTLSAPLLREGVAIGAILIRRSEVRPFTDKQIALLQTFADQAVIAIENVRLFTELQGKNRALTEAHAQVSEALDQQTATSEILKVISRSPTDVQPVFDAIAESAMRLCDAGVGGVLTFDGELVHLAGMANIDPLGVGVLRDVFPMAPSRGSASARAILTREVVNIPDVLAEPDYGIAQQAAAVGFRSIVSVPMLREGRVLGAVTSGRATPGPFTDKQIALLQTFADQAMIAIENVRLFNELQGTNRALTASLEQQTATSEVLRAIAHTQTDAQPVFDTIVRSAARLCDAPVAAVFLTDGRMLYHMANYGSSPEGLKAQLARFPRPVAMDTVSGMAILARTIVHVPDIEDPSTHDFVQQSGRLLGFRSVVGVPMLREGESMGVLNVTRREAGRFSDTEVDLLKTFADQAVIAIENVRLFNDLELANRGLQAASRHKSEFLANMSHELRTPLNAVLGFSEVLSERMFGELNEKQEEYLKDIQASGQHLLSLINDILDLSKVEAGRMELELTDFHLPAALDNAMTLVRERAARRGIALHADVDERLGQIQADERKIRQVVLNLLSNAIKFTPEGGSINIRAIPGDGVVKVSVGDTGAGIAPEDQEAIFEEFKQVGTAAKKVEGTGLGLALSRKFVELHGGRIWVTSELGAGSTFTFTIPMRIGA